MCSGSSHSEDADSEEPAVTLRKWHGPNKPHKLVSLCYFLPLVPSNTRVSVLQLAANHGVVDFLPCLTEFLWNIDPNLPTLPLPQDCFDVYKCFTIITKPLNRVQSEDVKDIVRATPGGVGNRRSTGSFDTVLVHEDERAGSLGFEGA